MIKTGVDRSLLWLPFLEGKRIGLLTNPTGVDRNLKSTIDILNEKVNLVKLFSPEHGVRGNIQAGEKISDTVDYKTGLPVCTLYGEHKMPTEEDLNEIDVMVFDIQDVGSRLYTYMYSMAYAMSACGKYGKSFVVFDRPNPVGGLEIEGNMVEEDCRSFIGLYPLPYRYGLTIGETARLFCGEYGVECELHIIPMEGWSRGMYFEDTGLPWVLPSPNMPTVDTAIVYNATCFLEGTNISEGRGTTKPFELVGAPFYNADELADAMNGFGLPGVIFRPAYFTPTFSKFQGELCRGVQLHVTNRDEFKPVKTMLYLLHELIRQGGENFEFLPPLSEKLLPMIDLNSGSHFLRNNKAFDPEKLYYEWQKDAALFGRVKLKYELY